MNPPLSFLPYLNVHLTHTLCSLMSDHLTPSTSHQKKAIVAGAGPVGCLTALSLAKKGWIVELWEGRPGECVQST
jgi:ribulose 1,5-bisphosphate synthetase/thiazole synthase